MKAKDARKALPKATRARRLSGVLQRISPAGAALATQRVSWAEWPEVGRVFAVNLEAQADARAWQTARVDRITSYAAESLEFVADGASYRLVFKRGAGEGA